MAAAAAAAPEQKRKPGWMSMPGGPREPDFKVFQAKLTSLVAEKKKCFEDLKAIREEFDAARGETGDRSKIDGERSQLRDRISKIDADRRKERDNRKEADRRIDEVRKERLSIQRQLEALADEVGAFESVAEIDMAIDVVEFKMATGAGSLKAEKECIKRINKLQEAKDLLLQLEPLEEAIADSQERELDLRQESRDIHARIQALNDDYMKNLQLKIEKDNERKANTFDFSALHERRSKVSKKIDDLNKQIDDLRAEFDKSREAWNEWRVVAKERFEAQIKAEREERDRARKEADAARKLARRRERAQHKMNPHKVEIEICGTLIGYLEQKVRIHNREQEEAEKRKKLAAFDPSAAAPKGAVVKGGNDDDWLFGDRTGKKAAKPAPKKAEGEKTAKPAATEVAKDAKKKQVHHSQDKLAQFEKVKVEAPLTFGAIEAAVDTLKKQKKEYESKIVVNVDDVELSESDNEGEAAGEAADDATQVASTAAPTAA